MLTLSIRDKNGEERVLEFDKEEVTIGRTQGSDIVLPRNNISKRHARLVDKDDKVVIVDLRSTNGTYVNGRRITAPEILTPDDKVYIGDFVIRLQTGDGTDAGDSDDARQQLMTKPGPPPAPGPVSEGPTEGSDAPVEATVAIAAAPDPEPDGKPVAKTVAAMPPVTDVPAAAPPSAPPPEPEPEPAPAPAPSPAPAPAPAAAAAPAPVAAAPRMTTLPHSGASVEAVKKRLFMAIGGERGASKIVKECKWKGLSSQITKAVQQARDAGELQTVADNETVADEVLADLVGTGPVEHLLAADDVHAVHVNAFDDIVVVKAGGAEKSKKVYPSNAILARSVHAIAAAMGHDVELLGPVFDGNLPSGASVSVIGSPVSGGAPVIVARKARAQVVTPASLVERGGLSGGQLDYLTDAIARRKNIVVAGRPGSGRTTIANALGHLIPSTERVALVEKVRSISLPHDNIVRLDRDGIDAAGADIADLLPRVLAERAILDEVSGAEVYEYVALAMGGADGLIAVMQGFSASKLLSRMALQLELIAGSQLTSARAMVAAAVDAVVVVERDGDKSKVTELLEVEASADGFSTRQVGG